MTAHVRERPRAGEVLGRVGRATRHAPSVASSASSSVFELWALPTEDLALAKRLVSLGEQGVGGFDAGYGEDAEGVFVLRRVPTRTLDALVRGDKLDGLSALAKIRDVAHALAACEASAIFPGPLEPRHIALGSAGHAEAFILAEGWVSALLGGAGETSPSPRWTPPEQSAGAPWDNAANRYVLGLAAYRLLSGAHPFSGVGLRDAMKAQASAPPPFEDAIARALRPGIQSLVLALLDPDPKKRPSSARAIATRCEELLRDEALPNAGGPSVRARPTAPSRAASVPVASRARVSSARSPRSTARSSPRRRLVTFLPVAAGLALVGASLASRATPAPPSPRPVVSATMRPLERTTSETCAPCHARQVAEWQRSVMAHASKSPLFGALESVVEEQVGRDFQCPNGAGVLRRAGSDVCRDERTSLSVTGTGGEHWCVNCHAAGDNIATSVPPWASRFESGRGTAASSKKPLKDLLSTQALEGISCAVCHQTIGPVHDGQGSARASYQGNPSWISPVTGNVFRMRPEDGAARFGIANSGYLLDPSSFVTPSIGAGGAGDPIVHRRAPADAKRYLGTSEFCGACHDVRLFGTDSIGVRDRGEHFKRLRNAYSEWRTWADAEKSAGRSAASCQDCHMSTYPGVCVQGASQAGGAIGDGCPPGFRFEARAPGERPRGLVAASSPEPRAMSSHYFTSVDLPLAPELPDALITDRTLDGSGMPIGLEARRDQLLRHTFRFTMKAGSRVGARLELPIEIQNTGAGHRVPAGFSQEREIWVELTVKDARGQLVYEVGKLPNEEADLQDKAFVRITTRDDALDAKGRPLGVFGADIVDGPDVPQWSPNPISGGTTFRGRGLVNFQNGFLRCVRCIGVVDAQGRCQPGPGQGRTRADRFDDGAYDLDTGECRSNLSGDNAFLETYFPVGALDADRGIAKAPDAIIDTRSAPPGVVLRYTYDLDTRGQPGPFRVEARLRFRPFPPFLLRAFAEYEARKAAQGQRPSGPLLTPSVFRRNHPVDLAEATLTVD